MRVINITGKRRYVIAAAILLLVAILLAALWPRQLISTVSSGFRRVPIYEVATEEPAVAISFDASWGAEYTPAILDVLDQYEVKTTFFLVNIWIEDYPELAAEIVARGHEIGLHSATHPYFTQLSDAQVLSELEDNAAMIAEVTGYQPSLFRPPYGDYDNRVLELVEAAGYIPIQWSVDSLDWKDLSAAEITTRVLKDIHAGDIVLLHNNGRHTAEALPVILQQLQDQGLSVVPVSELLLTGDCYIDYNGIQRSS